METKRCSRIVHHTPGDQAFEGCSSLTKINIPNTVTKIGREAFSCCENLTTATLPGSIAAIGKDAFSLCETLTIYGEAGSAAETYAKENGLEFQLLGMETTS